MGAERELAASSASVVRRKNGRAPVWSCGAWCAGGSVWRGTCLWFPSLKAEAPGRDVLSGRGSCERGFPRPFGVRSGPALVHQAWSSAMQEGHRDRRSTRVESAAIEPEAPHSVLCRSRVRPSRGRMKCCLSSSSGPTSRCQVRSPWSFTHRWAAVCPSASVAVCGSPFRAVVLVLLIQNQPPVYPEPVPG